MKERGRDGEIREETARGDGLPSITSLFMLNQTAERRAGWAIWGGGKKINITIIYFYTFNYLFILIFLIANHCLCSAV